MIYVYRVRCSPQLLAARLVSSEREARARIGVYRRAAPAYVRFFVDRLPVEVSPIGDDAADTSAALAIAYHERPAPDRVDLYLSGRDIWGDWPALVPALGRLAELPPEPIDMVAPVAISPTAINPAIY